MKVGYLGMSAKPFHAGHYFIVKVAAEQCDYVQLYISLSDRARPGEVPILGSTMKEIWDSYLLGIMPNNVNVEFPTSPIRAIYERIGDHEKGNDTETIHVIFSDPEDLSKNFPEKKLNKYFPNLMSNHLIVLQPMPRTSTIDISGTKMRKYLETGQKNEFIKGLPGPAQVYGNEIYNLLLGGKT